MACYTGRYQIPPSEIRTEQVRCWKTQGPRVGNDVGNPKATAGETQSWRAQHLCIHLLGSKHCGVFKDEWFLSKEQIIFHTLKEAPFLSFSTYIELDLVTLEL